MRWIVIVAVLALGGCTVLQDVGGPPPAQQYLLVPELPPRQSAPADAPVLSVTRPAAPAGYDTRRMVYTVEPLKLDYYQRNEWVDTLPRMLEPLLIEALQGSGRFRVVSVDAGVGGDLRLETTILAALQEFHPSGSFGRVELRATVIDPARYRLVATRKFDASVPAENEDPYGGVIALNRAFGEVLRELTDFVTSVVVENGM